MAQIRSAYENALVQCHALACDKAASKGEICWFNLSSTVSKARRALAKDGLTRTERVRQWYQKRKEGLVEKPVEAMTREELHLAMARSLGLPP